MNVPSKNGYMSTAWSNLFQPRLNFGHPKDRKVLSFSPDSFLIISPASFKQLLLCTTSVVLLCRWRRMAFPISWLEQVFMTDGTNVWHGRSISGSIPFLKSCRRQTDGCPEGFDPILVLLCQYMLCWSRGGGARSYSSMRWWYASFTQYFLHFIFDALRNLLKIW